MLTDQSVHRWAIDGLEEGTARIEEDGARMIEVPLRLLRRARGPAPRRDPDGGGMVTDDVALDQAATAAALAKSQASVDGIAKASRKRDAGGDVVL